jgi:hypothetical protein
MSQKSAVLPQLHAPDKKAAFIQPFFVAVAGWPTSVPVLERQINGIGVSHAGLRCIALQEIALWQDRDRCSSVAIGYGRKLPGESCLFDALVGSEPVFLGSATGLDSEDAARRDLVLWTTTALRISEFSWRSARSCSPAWPNPLGHHLRRQRRLPSGQTQRQGCLKGGVRHKCARLLGALGHRDTAVST